MSCHIDLRGVDKRFGSEFVLQGIDMQVRRGEFASLIGPSGCGKSTLLRLVAGLENAQTGTITFESLPSGEGPTSDTLRRPRCAFVFQDASLLPWRTAYGNVALPLELESAKRSAYRRDVNDQLDRVGLRAEDHGKLPRMLSGGMKMRVSLARALVTQPEILLMDEPFGALDDILRTQLNQELLELWQTNQWTTLFVTHQVSEAVFLSDRVIVLSHRPGTIHAEVPIDLPRPRSPELRGTPQFAKLILDLQQLLMEVV